MASPPIEQPYSVSKKVATLQFRPFGSLTLINYHRESLFSCKLKIPHSNEQSARRSNLDTHQLHVSNNHDCASC